jgi:uncharacterized membrane protein (UPF0127 family)
MSAVSFSLINARTERAVADSVEVALSRNARRKGLLGRRGMAPFSALVLAPCAAVHTMFMRFAIDVIFVDAAGRAVHIVTGLPPWRAAIARVAHAVIELPAGTLASREVVVGDSLYLVPAGGGRLALSAGALRERLP